MDRRLGSRLVALVTGVLLAYTITASAATFNLFQPANGLLVGNPSTYVTTSATSSDVLSLWTGTCSASTYLRGDGSCQSPGSGSPGGADTNVQYNSSGSFAGSGNFTWNNGANTLTVTGDITTETLLADVVNAGPPDTMVVNGATINALVQANSDVLGAYEAHTHADSGLGGVFYGARSRGTEASPTVVADTDQLLGLYAVGYDGTDYAIGAAITAQVAGTPGSNDMPSSLVFATTADGANTPTTRLTIDPTGSSTFTGKVITPASATGGAGLNLPAGVAPTSPVDGDIWTTTSGVFARINGGTIGPLGAASGTVSSVDGAASGIFSITGGPITTSGTLTLNQTGTSGGIPYFSSTSALASSAALAVNQIVLGGGAGAAPATLGSLGTSTQVLHGNAGGAPTWGAVNLGTDVSGTLADGSLSSNVALLNRDPQTFTGVTRLSGNTPSASTPPVRIGDTGSTASTAMLSIVRAGLASFVARNTTNSVEAFFQPATSTVQFGSNTNHSVELLVNGATKATVNSAGDVAATTFTGSGANLTALNGTQVTTGTVADARLSSNVPLLNAANTFTNANAGVFLSAADPYFKMRASSADADERIWWLQATSNGGVGNFRIRAVNDAENAAEDVFSVTRTGATGLAMALVSDSITLNGVASSDFARLSQANTFAANQAINKTSATNAYFAATADSSVAIYGVSDTAGGIISGDSAGDAAITGKTGISLSANDGSALHMRINSSGNFDFKAGTVTTSNASASEVGFKGVPQNSQSSGYTLALTDAGKHVLMTTNNTITIPANGTVAFPIGTVVTFVCTNASGCSVAITSDTLTLAGTTTTGTRTLVQNGMATAIKTGSTAWVISGAGISSTFDTPTFFESVNDDYLELAA